MKLSSIAALGVACVAMSACATVTRGKHDAWTVQSEPSGAAVKTSNDFHCEATPCTFTMERKAEFDVTVTKPGYKTWTGHVTHHISKAGGAGMAGNVILGGVIGAAVDSTSGAMMDLVPNPLTVKLEPEEKRAEAATPATQQ